MPYDSRPMDPMDPPIIVGSTQKWRRGQSRVNIIGAQRRPVLIVGAQSPELDMVKSWFAARSPVDLVLGAALGALAMHLIGRK